MWEWLPAKTIAAGCRSHQKVKHIGAQLTWKPVMVRGAILIVEQNPPGPLFQRGRAAGGLLLSLFQWGRDSGILLLPL